MRSDWVERQLGEYIEVTHGFAFKGDFFTDEASRDVLVTPGNFRLGGGFRGEKIKFCRGPVPEDFVLESGDLIITMTDLSKTSDTLGYPAIVPEWNGHRFLHNQRLGKVLIRDESLLDKRFLYYVLCTREYRNEVLASSTGTAVKHTAPSRIRAFSRPWPCLDEQRAIGRVLGRLDDKIELNRRMNETLEATARAIFRSWFVDFDPVVARAEGRRRYGMSAETAWLFPDSFQDSAIGPIPKGWEPGSVADIADYLNGRNFTKNATGTGRMVIRIAELNSGPGGSTIYNDVEADPVNVAYPDDILFAWSGSLDVYRWHRDEALINQHIFKVICEKHPKWFVFFQLQEAMPFFQLIASGKATTMGHIKRSHLAEAKLVIPPSEALDAGTRAIQPLYGRIHKNERESQTLAAIRDALLPRLLSGEIRLKAAEKAIEEAT